MLLGASAIVAVVMTIAATQAPSLAAAALLHPIRRSFSATTPRECADFNLDVAERVTIRGWRCRPPSLDGTRASFGATSAPAPARATVVYLHGVADHRASATGVIKRLTGRGFDVVAYDSRAHGQSSGDTCTYGFFEKTDLRRVLDLLDADEVVLFGHSLGGAVALQTAAEDRRVAGVISVESFSDLRTVARERAFFLPSQIVDRAFRYAEEHAGFEVDRVSPVAAARHITVPVLLVHGKADAATRPAHSQRIFDALAGPKRIILVDAAAHNQSLGKPGVWSAVDAWLDEVTAETQLMQNRQPHDRNETHPARPER